MLHRVQLAVDPEFGGIPWKTWHSKLTIDRFVTKSEVAAWLKRIKDEKDKPQKEKK